MVLVKYTAKFFASLCETCYVRWFTVFNTRESQKGKAMLACLKSDLGSTEKDGGYKQYEPSIICS
jgi:hypothetical protein